MTDPRSLASRGGILAAIRSANIRVTPTSTSEVPGDIRRSLGLRRAPLLGHLVDRLGDYGVTVTRLGRDARARPGRIAATVAQRLAAHDARSLIVPPGVTADWRPDDLQVVEDEPGLTHAAIDRFDAVLTGSACAIAESGTIVLDHGPDQGRRALTVLPRVHVCVLEAANVVGLLPEAMTRLAGARLMTFISGPSATADIEFERVVGVHGPRFLEVILLA